MTFYLFLVKIFSFTNLLEYKQNQQKEGYSGLVDYNNNYVNLETKKIRGFYIGVCQGHTYQGNYIQNVARVYMKEL